MNQPPQVCKCDVAWSVFVAVWLVVVGFPPGQRRSRHWVVSLTWGAAWVTDEPIKLRGAVFVCLFDSSVIVSVGARDPPAAVCYVMRVRKCVENGERVTCCVPSLYLQNWAHMKYAHFRNAFCVVFQFLVGFYAYCRWKCTFCKPNHSANRLSLHCAELQLTVKVVVLCVACFLCRVWIFVRRVFGKIVRTSF
jgi:hypothetical protein